MIILHSGAIVSLNLLTLTADWYDADAYQDAPGRNPQGPSEGEWKVLRGGSWFDPPELGRVTNRSPERPDYRFDNVGFRPAL